MKKNKKTLYLLNEIIKKEINNKQVIKELLDLIKKVTETISIIGWVYDDNGCLIQSLEQVRKNPIFKKINELEKIINL